MTSTPEPDEQAPTAGLFAGRFRLGPLLGTGGSASAFEATDAETGQRVALKLLHPHLAASETFRDAFLAEAGRAEGLRHPHIAAVLARGTGGSGDTGTAWIAQELAPGVTLSEIVAADGPLTPAQAIDVGVAVLGALGAVHRAGLVHRDVSPANVMVSRVNGRVEDVRLLDFGLADAAGARALGADVLRSTGAAAGEGVIANVHYASPEQLRGDAVDERGDVYQVGGLLYFALTGSAPFPLAERDAVVQAHLTAPPPVPSVRVRGILPSLDRAVVRALLKDPADRFDDADAMRAALIEGARAVRMRAPSIHVARATATPASSRTHVLDTPAPPTTGAPAIDAERPPTRRGGFGVWVVVGVALALAVGMALPAVLPSEALPEPDVPTASATAEPTISAPPVLVAEPVVEAETIAVPTAATLAELRAAIEAAGLRLGSVDVVDAAQPKDTVLAVTPTPGTPVELGTTIAVTVASGSNAVPTVTGLAGAEAVGRLRDAGYDVRESLVPADQVVAGRVIGTAPSEGSSVAVGAVVWVYIAEAPPRPAPLPTEATPKPTPTSTEPPR